MSRLLVVGYYGARNYGDELMLLSLLDLDDYSRYDEIVVLSLGDGLADVDELAEIKKGVCSRVIRARSIRSGKGLIGKVRSIVVLMKEVFRCDSIVFGGGTLFFDNVSSKWRNMLGVFKVSFLAKWIGRPYAFVGVGVGEVETYLGGRIFRYCVKNAECIQVRDTSSFQLVARHRADVRQGRDLAFDVDFSSSAVSDIVDNIFDEKQLVINLMEFGYREVGGFDINSVVDAVLGAILKYKKKDCSLKIVLLPMQNGKLRSDSEVLDFFRKKAELVGVEVDAHYDASFSEKHRLLLGANKVLTMRYHPAVVALCCNKIPFALSITDKLGGFMAEHGLRDYSVDLRVSGDGIDLLERVHNYLVEDE